MGYPDFPIPDQNKSYIPQRDMLTFLELYAQRFNVYENIKFEQYVMRVRPYGDEDQWEIVVRDLPSNAYNTYIFDAIIVCNGHYHTPVLPKYPGKQLFQGQQIHSHDYRSADPFEGNTVKHAYSLHSLINSAEHWKYVCLAIVRRCQGDISSTIKCKANSRTTAKSYVQSGIAVTTQNARIFSPVL